MCTMDGTGWQANHARAKPMRQSHKKSHSEEWLFTPRDIHTTLLLPRWLYGHCGQTGVTLRRPAIKSYQAAKPLVVQLSDLRTYALRLVTRRIIRILDKTSYGEKPLFSPAVLASISGAVCIVGAHAAGRCAQPMALPEDVRFTRRVVALWRAFAELALQFGDVMVDAGLLSGVPDCKCRAQHYHKDAAELGKLYRVVLHRNSWASLRGGAVWRVASDCWPQVK